jgi:hypothetical protein
MNEKYESAIAEKDNVLKKITGKFDDKLLIHEDVWRRPLQELIQKIIADVNIYSEVTRLSSEISSILPSEFKRDIKVQFETVVKDILVDFSVEVKRFTSPGYGTYFEYKRDELKSLIDKPNELSVAAFEYAESIYAVMSWGNVLDQIYQDIETLKEEEYEQWRLEDFQKLETNRGTVLAPVKSIIKDMY